MAKIMISINSAWNLFNFRSGLIRALVAAGHEVIAVAPSDEYVVRLMSTGCRFINLSMDNNGTHPLRDAFLLLRYIGLMKKERPDVFLGYTIKPNIFGSIAAKFFDIPTINNIAGLGAVFINKSWLTSVVRRLYRISLSDSARVFFQNPDDRVMFVSDGIVADSVADLLPGSGVDLDRFFPVALPSGPKVRFLLIARMLWDKGVGEYVDAARSLLRLGICAEFCMLGFLDVKNPAAIPREDVNKWVSEGVVRYLGVSDDVRKEIEISDCIVLPSYREGTPRTLLEAAAMARPIVTTDAVGCREVVDDGVNGYLCCPRDSDDLADKLLRIASMDRADREAMGLLGREKMKLQFDENIVISKYLNAIESLI